VIMCMRWFGDDDPVPLAHIRQVPGVRGVVGARFDIPVGEPWPVEAVRDLREKVERSGLRLEVIESVPVHEAIKLGTPERDRYIEAFAESIGALAAAGVRVLCYNFMPLFDWLRTDLAKPLEDGSTTLAYDPTELDEDDILGGFERFPAWVLSFDRSLLPEYVAAYQALGTEGLHGNLAYFISAVAPVAARAGVRLALHPDDPPWPVFGVPRIATDAANLARILTASDDPHHGLTFCTGSLGASLDNDLPAMVGQFAGRIHFVHARNVRVDAPRHFLEVQHPSEYGRVNMRAVLQALLSGGFDGPIRPDHGRMIWGERGRAGYGLYDRALGAAYLHGLAEGLRA
jgi:mannonate dehydratase